MVMTVQTTNGVYLTFCIECVKYLRSYQDEYSNTYEIVLGEDVYQVDSERFEVILKEYKKKNSKGPVPYSVKKEE